MRTTIDIDEDVLLAAKDLAMRQQAMLGHTVTDLIRRALKTYTAAGGVERNRVKPFAVRADAPLLTLETVNRHRDEE
jgi:hypothetical protein